MSTDVDVELLKIWKYVLVTRGRAGASVSGHKRDVILGLDPRIHILQRRVDPRLKGRG